MTTSDDRDIATRIRAGDVQGFHLLYERHADRVLGFALRLTGSRADAEDIVQEVFAAAYDGRATFGGRSRPLAWLLGIAARRWRDRRRHKAPDTAPLTDGAELLQPGSLEAGVINALTLSQALERLAPPLREALLLVASQGLTYKEAAEVLDTPVGTVKWRVFEAMRKMRGLLSAVEEEFDGMQRAEPGTNHVPCGG